MKVFLIGLALVLLFSVGLIVWASSSRPELDIPVTPEPTKVISLDSDVMWNTVQEWRKSVNLSEYVKSEQLCKISDDRVLDGFDMHKGLLAKYSNYPVYISENIAVNDSEKNALDWWLNSASHSAALHASYKYSCISCKGNYCVQIFSNL